MKSPKYFSLMVFIYGLMVLPFLFGCVGGRPLSRDAVGLWFYCDSWFKRLEAERWAGGCEAVNQLPYSTVLSKLWLYPLFSKLSFSNDCWNIETCSCSEIVICYDNFCQLWCLVVVAILLTFFNGSLPRYFSEPWLKVQFAFSNTMLRE